MFRDKGPPLGDFPPPPLPSLSSDILARAFVHSSNKDSSLSRFEYEADFVDNERLELLGDALLYQVVAHWLFTSYPKLKVHYLTAIRQKLVQNETLAFFSRLYNLDEALQLPPDLEYLRSQTKVQADTFEAYLGALYLQKGQDFASQWIIKLVQPYASQFYDYYKVQAEKQGPKTLPFFNRSRYTPAAALSGAQDVDGDENAPLLGHTSREAEPMVEPSTFSFLCCRLPMSCWPFGRHSVRSLPQIPEPVIDSSHNDTSNQVTREQPVRIAEPRAVTPSSSTSPPKKHVTIANTPSNKHRKSPKIAYAHLSDSDGGGDTPSSVSRKKSRLNKPADDPAMLAAEDYRSSVFANSDKGNSARTHDSATSGFKMPTTPLPSKASGSAQAKDLTADQAVIQLNNKLNGRQMQWDELPPVDGIYRIAAVLNGERIAFGAGPDLRTALQRAVLAAIGAVPPMPDVSTPSKQSAAIITSKRVKQVDTPKPTSSAIAKSKLEALNTVTKCGVIFPSKVFDSLPSNNVPDNQRSYIITAGGADCQQWYYAVFDNLHNILAHSEGKSRGLAIDQATKQLKDGDVPDRISFAFNARVQPMPPKPSDPSGPPGAPTKLLHAFKQAGPARVLWLYWQAPETGIWKDVCFIDGVFAGAGKSQDHKQARLDSSLKAIETL